MKANVKVFGLIVACCILFSFVNYGADILIVGSQVQPVDGQDLLLSFHFDGDYKNFRPVRLI